MLFNGIRAERVLFYICLVVPRFVRNKMLCATFLTFTENCIATTVFSTITTTTTTTILGE